MASCLIALGANLGNRRESLDRAIALLVASGKLTLSSQSNWHETAAVGGPADQGAYLNGAALFATSLPPLDLLAELQWVEAELGRVRETSWGPRSIDLDLLIYDDLVIETPALTVPHPRMAFRRFVIEPAAEAAPDLRHPVIGWTMSELRDHLRCAPLYVAFAGPPGVGKSQLARRLAEAIGACFIDDPRAALPPRRTADSAGRTIAEEIELLALRCHALSEAARGLPTPIVSDFWLPQSLAYAEASGNPQFSGRRAAAVAEHVSQALRPKLLVLVDDIPRDAVTQTNATRDARADPAERLRAALRSATERPGVGPLLKLSGTDLAARSAEITAAVAAMEPGPTD